MGINLTHAAPLAAPQHPQTACPNHDKPICTLRTDFHACASLNAARRMSAAARRRATRGDSTGWWRSTCWGEGVGVGEGEGEGEGER